MLEYLNSAACFLLMLYSLPVAMAVGNNGMWPQRLSIVAVQFGLFLQATNPWAGWCLVSWPSVFLHVSAAVMLTVWWRRAWIFVQSYLTPAEDLQKRRRREDWPAAHRPAVIRRTLSGTPKH